jgi:hypothetical protein
MPLRRFAVIWTRKINGTLYVDPIWHVDARSEKEALKKARETERPEYELSVEEQTLR